MRNLPIALKNALEIQDEDSLYCFAAKYWTYYCSLFYSHYLEVMKWVNGESWQTYVEGVGLIRSEWKQMLLPHSFFVMFFFLGLVRADIKMVALWNVMLL
jgi:hypothetical protein